MRRSASGASASSAKVSDRRQQMTSAARERSQVRTPILLISAAAWILLVIEPSGLMLPDHCPVPMLKEAVPSVSLNILLALNPYVSLMAGWSLMLAAMMVPLLTAPVRHVRDRSFAQRRVFAIALFAIGYATIWMTAGVMLLALAMLVKLFDSATALPLTLLIALVWQFSPFKQRCLNRCHAQPELAAFGRAANDDAMRFGLIHGFWCVGSCWALMLLPLFLSREHVAAMATVALWLLAERLDAPIPPRWRWRGPSKAVSLAVAQARMHLQRSRKG
jgi:predicted metal-binding membrane protein